MTLSESEFYPARRFHFTVALLSILLIILVLIGLLSHRTIPVNHPVWKSSPYSDLRDTANIRALH